jgi:hypothetical protein
MCGFLIHIRLRRFFQFLMPELRHGQHRYLSTVIWFDHLVSTYDDIFGCLHRWGFVESPAFDCGAEEQTMHHIVEDCPLRLFADGLIGLFAMRQWTETVDRRDSGVPIWFGLESLTNVFNIKRMNK